ncbi:nucleotide pyrophosphohydrolase [Saccharopolyspora shandongensis]|uniref:nucleotide pyrophosphohydrolase n=1 Tax=Saccharopolyspora shandongensis TaxID=418495 RepID=UPI00344AE7E5
MDSLDDMRDQLRGFAAAREWEQFHTPKNLAMALTGEVGELVAELQWLGDAEIDAQLEGGTLRDRLSDEVADVMLYLLRFSDVCGIDLVAAAAAKVERNEQRYPADLARGTAAKYTELGRDRPASSL